MRLAAYHWAVHPILLALFGPLAIALFGHHALVIALVVFGVMFLVTLVAFRRYIFTLPSDRGGS